MKERHTPQILLSKLKRQMHEIQNRIMVYSEQNLNHEVAHLQMKEEIIKPIIWELENIVTDEQEHAEKLRAKLNQKTKETIERLKNL